jgi:hypothetical protein
MAKTALRYAMMCVLWVVSCVLGGVAVVQAYEATRVVAALTIPINHMQEVMSRKQVLLVSRMALVLLTCVWIVVVILLLVRYLRLLSAGRELWRTFGITTAVELAVLGIAAAIVHFLPSLALGGGI